jgi:DNA-binding NarL/FixJ family response regulator
MDKHQMKALLVENEGFIRESLKLLINDVMPELSVVAVGSLTDARRALADATYDFIFLDIDLSEEQTGLDFLDELKEDDVPTRVIMLSNNDAPDVVLDSVKRGAFGFLPKATEDPTTIRFAVDTVLKGGVYLPASIHTPRMKSPYRRPRDVPEITPKGPVELNLPPRTFEAVYWATTGLKNKGIARKMGISQHSVADHLQIAYREMKVTTRTELMSKLQEDKVELRPPAQGAV